MFILTRKQTCLLQTHVLLLRTSFYGSNHSLMTTIMIISTEYITYFPDTLVGHDITRYPFCSTCNGRVQGYQFPG